MKKFLAFCIIVFSVFSVANCQEDYEIFYNRPSMVYKFSPRILSPRFTVEKVFDKKSSFSVETRIHAYWLPQAIRFEPAYRIYFSQRAPFGAYVNFKGAVGYFDYGIANLNTKGLMAGGGINFGGQYKIGSKKAVVDVFGGIQVITPIYFTIDANNPNGLNVLNAYNLVHYTLIAFPVEFGLRFGFFKLPTLSTPNDNLTSPKNKNFNF